MRRISRLYIGILLTTVVVGLVVLTRESLKEHPVTALMREVTEKARRVDEYRASKGDPRLFQATISVDPELFGIIRYTFDESEIEFWIDEALVVLAGLDETVDIKASQVRLLNVVLEGNQKTITCAYVRFVVIDSLGNPVQNEDGDEKYSVFVRLAQSEADTLSELTALSRELDALLVNVDDEKSELKALPRRGRFRRPSDTPRGE